VRSNVDLLLRGAFWMALVQPLAAQQAITSATLGGRIEDASGSVVAGAVVEARETDRGRVFSQAADSTGRFQFLRLTPGAYSITVLAPRFEPVRRT
jgi:protocatechuate 3,4-dioxygenase beta subunit